MRPVVLSIGVFTSLKRGFDPKWRFFGYQILQNFFFSVARLIEDSERQLSSASYTSLEYRFRRLDEYERTLATLLSRFCETYRCLENREVHPFYVKLGSIWLEPTGSTTRVALDSTRLEFFFVDSNFKISTRVCSHGICLVFGLIWTYILQISTHIFLLHSMYFTSFDLSIVFSHVCTICMILYATKRYTRHSPSLGSADAFPVVLFAFCSIGALPYLA